MLFFVFGAQEKRFKNIRKKSISLINQSNISYFYSKNFSRIFLKLILTNTTTKSREQIEALHWESLLPVQLAAYLIFQSS